MTKKTDVFYGPYYGKDLLGLQILRWKLLTTKRKDEIITDFTLCQLLSLFQMEPNSLPVSPELQIRDFYYLHGFCDTPKDRKEFAKLIGRSVPSVYRLLTKTGNPIMNIVTEGVINAYKNK